MKLIKTIVGKLDSNCILKIKNKQWNGYVMPIKGNIFQKLTNFQLEKENKKKFIKVKKTDFLVPFQVNNIIGIGKNFNENYDSKNLKKFKLNPDFFTMNKNALIPSGKKTILPHFYRSVLVEGEIGIVIKKKCKNILPKQSGSFILGYVICNDYSGRDLSYLESDNVLLRKSSDGFLPVGPAVKIGYQKKPFEIKTEINGKKIQLTNTKQLILDMENIVSILSNCITLYKNDLICTGSGLPKPKVKNGDSIKIEVEGLGNLYSRIANKK